MDLNEKFSDIKVETFKVRLGKTSNTLRPTIIELGGVIKGGGRARIVCGEHGEKLRPTFIKHGKIYNGGTAIFVVYIGVHLVEVIYDHGPVKIRILRVVDIDKSEDPMRATVEKVAWFARDTWNVISGDVNVQDFMAAIDAAVEKSACDGCAHVHYALDIRRHDGDQYSRDLPSR